MWIISKSRLRDFWQTHAEAEASLAAWHRHVETVDWSKSNDVKEDFAHASFVGNCTVFNIGGNKFRLVTRILYPYHKVYILRVMTHKQYDVERWAKDCGCHEPPPAKTKRRPKRSQRRPRG